MLPWLAVVFWSTLGLLSGISFDCDPRQQVGLQKVERDVLRLSILSQPCQCPDGRSRARSVCRRQHNRKHTHTTGTCAANLDGGGLQNLERLWAGHDAAEAVLAILLEGEALLPRQSAQRAAFLP